MLLGLLTYWLNQLDGQPSDQRGLYARLIVFTLLASSMWNLLLH